MTAQLLEQVLENRTDNCVYTVWRNGRSYKRYWQQMSNEERALQIESENRARYEDLFNIYDF